MGTTEIPYTMPSRTPGAAGSSKILIPDIAPRRVVILQVAARPAPGYPAAEFVWLDVACIDQTPGSPV
ncbi:hypothetical protein PG994_005632 [Apiospora phragmitis]|uniref:Heterokaryon incompatibility domain-containing protein n=1 Tax=Apiospora phragmitis TaxID=2905665 RepID=A0ABR1VCS1_9PEZI